MLLRQVLKCCHSTTKYARIQQYCVVSKNEGLKTKYDVIIVGAGHNGLVAANYLQRSGLDVCVLERRHVIGGAAVTETIIPGFKFSRASYVLSLLRPHILKDLDLHKHGLKIHLRNPSSYTPIHEKFWEPNKGRSLTLGWDSEENQRQISQFSKADSKKFEDYEKMIERFLEALDPFLDASPPTFTDGKINRLELISTALRFFKMGRKMGKEIVDFYELCTAPANKILNKWFESDVLKATLATDAFIGTMDSSGYVLLHHMMGELEGIKGAWGYPEGGMGAVTQSLAKSAVAQGVQIFVNKPVASIKLNSSAKAVGVLTHDGEELSSKCVLSNATPNISYLKLLSEEVLPEHLVTQVKNINYTSPVTKINVAVNKLPNFKADPNKTENETEAHHQCTIHLNCENMDMLEDARQDALQGRPSKRPMIEMVIPSSLDKTLAPENCHVCLLFTQFTPNILEDGRAMDEKSKLEHVNRVFDQIEEYAPGFKESIIGYEALSPPDLENIFGLTGGNIFHGTMSLDQLFVTRPTKLAGYKTPIAGYYLCGSGTHPGGGVMGAPGYNAAQVVMKDLKKNI